MFRDLFLRTFDIIKTSDSRFYLLYDALKLSGLSMTLKETRNYIHIKKSFKIIPNDSTVDLKFTMKKEKFILTLFLLYVINI